jgi:hypothetical protein
LTFDFFDFKGWHGSIAVQETGAEPFDLRCRLWGSQLTEIFGSDNTGKLYSEYGQGYRENDIAFLTGPCRSGPTEDRDVPGVRGQLSRHEHSASMDISTATP